MRIVDRPPDENEPATPSEKALAEIEEDEVGLRNFDLKEVDIVLGVLAVNGGNVTRTSQQVMAEFDISIHPNTIRTWRKEKFIKRYTEIQDELTKTLDKSTADKLTHIQARNTSAQEEILDLIEQRLLDEPNIPLKDLAPALRNIAQTGHMNLQNRNLLLEKPTSITETRTVESKIKELEDDGILIDSDAEDITDAEVVKD